MTWERIDDRPIRNTGGSREHDHALVRRVYGWNGELWPRFTLAVYPRVCEGDDQGFVVGHALKKSPKHWWNSDWGIPCALYDDLREMLQDAGRWWKKHESAS